MTEIQKEQHCIARAYQRYGVLLNSQDLKAMAKLIEQDNNSVLYLGDSGNNTGKYMIMYDKTLFTIIYGYTRKQIITFLPKFNKYAPLA